MIFFSLMIENLEFLDVQEFQPAPILRLAGLQILSMHIRQSVFEPIEYLPRYAGHSHPT